MIDDFIIAWLRFKKQWTVDLLAKQQPYMEPSVSQFVEWYIKNDTRKNPHRFKV